MLPYLIGVLHTDFGANQKYTMTAKQLATAEKIIRKSRPATTESGLH